MQEYIPLAANDLATPTRHSQWLSDSRYTLKQLSSHSFLSGYKYDHIYGHDRQQKEDVLKSVEIEVAVSRTTVVKHGWTKNTKWEETANVRIPRQ